MGQEGTGGDRSLPSPAGLNEIVNQRGTDLPAHVFLAGKAPRVHLPSHAAGMEPAAIGCCRARAESSCSVRSPSAPPALPHLGYLGQKPSLSVHLESYLARFAWFRQHCVKTVYIALVMVGFCPFGEEALVHFPKKARARLAPSCLVGCAGWGCVLSLRLQTWLKVPGCGVGRSLKSWIQHRANPTGKRAGH